MALGLLPYFPFGSIHGFFAGALFPLILLLPLLSKKRTQLYKALLAKLSLPSRTAAKKNPFSVIAKVITLLMILTFLMQLTTGLLVDSGLGYQLFPGFAVLSFHMSFLYLLGGLILLHATFQYLSIHHKTAAKR